MALLALVCLACSPAPPAAREAAPPPQQQPPPPPPQQTPPPQPAPASSPASGHLRIANATFVDASGRRLEWRGISAFRLVEMIAHGREAEAVAFLDWAARQKLTVVRVFLMAHHLFRLTPEEGRAALPRLLELAGQRGLYVEAVLLADTGTIALDHAAHVRAAAAIAATRSNTLVEIANEPWHPTQDPRLHDPAYVKGLADLVPRQIPVALGSVEGSPGYAAGRYVTWHSPRSNAEEGWGHVFAIADGATLIAKWGKPVIADEPIGAAPAAIPGRRDDEPERFRIAAILGGLLGLGLTFHYEGGLQARIPEGRELECFAAWREGAELAGATPTPLAVVRPSDPDSPVRAGAADSARVVVLAGSNAAYVVGAGVPAFVAPQWKSGWTPTKTMRWPRSYVVGARKER